MHSSSPSGSLGRSTPPGERAPSARRFGAGSASLGGSVMLSSLVATLAAAAAIAMLLFAPRTVSIPLGMVLATYLLASLAHTAYEHLGRFGRHRRPAVAEPEPRVGYTAAEA